MAQKLRTPLEFVREDDYVEYYVFPQLPMEIIDETYNETNTKGQLDQLKAECLQLINKLLKERQYIWHKDTFQLQVRTCSKEEKLLLGEKNNLRVGIAEVASGAKRKTAALSLPPHLYGVTHYGDNITDEWFIVFLLREITKYLSNVVVRIVDSDGEFLLIEAADFLPKWANPDSCEQRVYLANGHIHLVQNSPTNTTNKLSVATALKKLQANPTLYRVSKDIENCIEERLIEFQDVNKHLMHCQIVRVPVGVASLLHARPDLIAPAVRAFCERDTIDMKACRSMLHFPPEQRVRVNVRFTRCLYAMLMHNNYTPERKVGWNLNVNPSNKEEFKEDLLGIKLACGFEILAAQAKHVEDNENGNNIENSPAWKTYKSSLEANGYFRNELVGSQEYERLLKQAKLYFHETELSYRTMSVVGKEILLLLKTLDINIDVLKDAEKNLKASDNDDWLNITPDELDKMLMKRYGVKKLYKTSGGINAEQFTNNIMDFLEQQSHLEGITKSSNSDSNTNDDDFGDADGDGDDSSSDNNMTNKKSTSKILCKRFQPKRQKQIKIKKNLSMRRACRRQKSSTDNNSSLDNTLPDGCLSKDESISEQMRSFLNFTLPEDKWDSYSDSDMDVYDDDDVKDIDNDDSDDDIEENFPEMINAVHNDEKIDKDIKAYMDEMDKELASTTIGQTFSSRQKPKGYSHNTNCDDDDDNFDDIENFEPIDINVNTLKNLMDSYKTQLGGVGPVTHLLNAMGAGMSAAIHKNDDGQGDKVDDYADSNIKKSKVKNFTESKV